MKKLIGMIVVCTLVLGLGVPALASGYSTTASYVGTAAEEITITVPASLIAGGAAGEVSVSGTWPSYKTISISAPAKVTLTNKLTGTEKETEINFSTIVAPGSDETNVSYSEHIGIDAPSVIFGTWTGTFNYTVSVSYESVGAGATLANTSWQFREDVSGYEEIIGVFRDDSGDHWNELPNGSWISGTYLDAQGTRHDIGYEMWGLCTTKLNDVTLFGPVQSIDEPWVFGYCPVDIADPFNIDKGWYMINGAMLAGYLYGEGSEHVTAEEIAQNGLLRAAAPTITIGTDEMGEECATLTNSAIIDWLRKNASMGVYAPAPVT